MPPIPKFKQQSFVQRNIIAIVMIPSIIGIHYGWWILQKNRTLVTADEEIEVPAIRFAKYVWNSLSGAPNAEVGKITSAPTVADPKTALK